MAFIDPQELLLLRLEAMRSVLRNDAGFTYRSICRWYSQNYNTPLHEVGTPGGAVPMEEVLLTFYEARYSEMDDGKKEAELNDLLMTLEDEVEEARRADIKEAEDWFFAQVIEKQEQKKKAKQRLEEIKLRERDSLVRKEDTPTPKPLPAPRLDNGLPTTTPQAPVSPKQPPRMLETALPEDVKVVFMTDEEMEQEASLMDPMSIEKGQPGAFQKPPQSKK